MMDCPFEVTPVARGEACVVYVHGGGQVEVMYRSSNSARIGQAQKALTSAWIRGAKEAARGWPYILVDRGLFGLNPEWFPIMDTTLTPEAPSVAVMSLHPRVRSWDLPIYLTPSLGDAEMVLTGCRRAATLGALRSTGRNTYRRTAT